MLARDKALSDGLSSREMMKIAPLLPSLLKDALSAIAANAAPSSELVTLVLAQIREAPKDEISQGLQVLWPYTRHITRDDWLEALFGALDTIPSSTPLRQDARAAMEQLVHRTPEQEEEAKKLLEGMDEFREYAAESFRRPFRRSSAAAHAAATLDLRVLSERADRQGEQPRPDEGPNDSEQTDPLASYLPKNDSHDYYGFWYEESSSSFFEDTRWDACSFLTRLALGLSVGWRDEALFWGVLGRVYEPFAAGNPTDLEERISTAKSAALDLRISTGNADLLDYWNYIEAYRELGDDFLDSQYTNFLAAIDRASAAECEGFFPALERLDFGRYTRPPRPEEERLPIADRLWEIVLSKPDVSLDLLARGGLFYWLCRDPGQAPPRALAALGRVCEGQHYEWWKILPFLPFWAASRGAAVACDWDFAAVCWKRALVDIAIFSRALDDEESAQVYAFPFDPRPARDIYTQFGDPLEKQLLALALKYAVRALQESPLDTWSQLHFVLLELSRRLGVKVVDEKSLKALIGTALCGQIDEETKRLLAEAEATWVMAEQQLQRQSDLAQIGWTYRRAIENEWRLRVAPTLEMLDEDIRKQPTLGNMLRVLGKSDPKDRQKLREGLAKVVPNDSRLFDQLFLRRAQDVVQQYLNRSAHSRLDHEQCRSLRSRLFDGRMLHDLLASVQPPAPRRVPNRVRP